GALAGGVQAGDRRLFRTRHHSGLGVRGDPAHAVVGGGLDGDGLTCGLDPEVHAGELRHVGDLRLDDVGIQVADIEVDVVLLVDAPPLLDLLVDGATHHVPGGQVLDGGGVAL